MIWFTSDTHAWHVNIIKYCNRPFNNVSHMTNIMADNINSVVRPNDTLYHLGDFSFRDKSCVLTFRNMIECKNIVLVLGNHDRLIRYDTDVRSVFHRICDIDIVKVSGLPNIVLCHYAMRIWPNRHHGAWHLYGHSHGCLQDPIPFSMDVGVDAHNFMPWSLEDIVEEMKKYQ